MSDRRLIEDSLPLAEISEYSAKEKSIRHGHISTLHLWWARRPLAAARAATMAALLPAPKDDKERKSFHRLLTESLDWELGKEPQRQVDRLRSILKKHSSGKTIKILDPFSGGGALPLEAERVGAEAFATDLNPVAHLIQLATLYYPQRFANIKSERTPEDKLTGRARLISEVERLKGRSGWLSLQRLRIESFDFEEYLLFSGMDDTGNNIDQETCEKLFNCSGQARAVQAIPDSAKERLMRDQERHAKATLAKNLEENNRHFSEARDQLDKWAEDVEMAAQKELDDTKRQIRDLQRRSRQAPTIEEQHNLQEEIAKLERKKRTLRERIFDIEDEIAEKRDRLVESLEKRMQQKTTVTPVFTIRWSVI
jgi:adenine-specific DNA methylase